MTKRFCLALSAVISSQPGGITCSVRATLTLTLYIAFAEPPSGASCERGICPISRSPDGSDTMFCALITLVCGLDVPDVRLERIATAANAHFSEVANGVLRFCQTYNPHVSTRNRMNESRHAGVLTKSSSPRSPLVRLVLIFFEDRLRAHEIPRT